MNSIICGLDIRKKGIISFTGAGGKTTLMMRIAEELARCDDRILVTTTTKIFPPDQEQKCRLLLTEDKDELVRRSNEAFKKHNYLIAASHECLKTNKLIGFSPEFVDSILQSGCFQWILTEADGSARKPIKAPASHEPAVPRKSNYILGVIGLSSLGKSVSDKHVHRLNCFEHVTGQTLGDEMDAATIASLIAHRNGLFRNCPGSAETIVFLNQADLLPRFQKSNFLAEQLFPYLPKWLNILAIGQANNAQAKIHIYTSFT